MTEETAFRARSRAQSLLLRAAGTPIKAIAEASQVHRVTVSAWIKQTPFGRTIALARRIPWSHRYILGSQSEACRLVD